MNAHELFEEAGRHDTGGRPAEAIRLYEQALAAGLGEDERPRALLQLGSSLRNVGRIDEAVAMLQEALAELLNAIADEGAYERSLRAYAAAL
ncbi:MAG TPA: tetratricopeptide repeat protein [Gaiellaceae bacterium]